MMTRLVLLSAGLALLAAPAAAPAQLLADRVQDNVRQCFYVGTEQTPDGQLAPRSATVPAGQPCPDSAPFRDPNLPPPGNAALVGDAVDNAGRRCAYSQGGVTYVRAIPANRPCAATPDLLDRELAAPDPAAP